MTSTLAQPANSCKLYDVLDDNYARKRLSGVSIVQRPRVTPCALSVKQNAAELPLEPVTIAPSTVDYRSNYLSKV